jgi:hypothetical protein
MKRGRFADQHNMAAVKTQPSAFPPNAPPPREFAPGTSAR